MSPAGLRVTDPAVDAAAPIVLEVFFFWSSFHTPLQPFPPREKTLHADLVDSRDRVVVPSRCRSRTNSKWDDLPSLYYHSSSPWRPRSASRRAIRPLRTATPQMSMNGTPPHAFIHEQTRFAAGGCSMDLTSPPMTMLIYVRRSPATAGIDVERVARGGGAPQDSQIARRRAYRRDLYQFSHR